MTTNILALPLAQMVVLTGTNEDWVDSIKFLVGPSIDGVDQPQLDIRGIDFEMEVRRNAPDHEVILQASTDDGKLGIGAAPEFGFLIINVPLDEMKVKKPGQYVADIVGRADNFNRVCVQMDLTIVEGITREP